MMLVPNFMPRRDFLVSTKEEMKVIRDAKKGSDASGILDVANEIIANYLVDSSCKKLLIGIQSK